jgi:hypothetical protein
MAKYATKGSHIAQALALVDRQLGPGAFLKLADRFGADHSWDTVLVNEWYDAMVLNQVLQVVSYQLKRSVEALTTDIARQNALQDLTSIYRMFMRIAEPVRLLRFTPQLWRNYVSFGDSSAHRNELGHYIGGTTGVPESLLEWVAGDWLGFIPTAIELAGGKIVSAQIVERERNGERSKVTCEIHYAM